MDQGFDPGALLAHTYTLPRGPRVRLRLARTRDVAAICALFLEQQGRFPDELEINRLVRFDPRRRAVICATALIDSTETIVGIGAIDLDVGLPESLIVDEDLTDGLDELLAQALTGRAAALRGRSAA